MGGNFPMQAEALLTEIWRLSNVMMLSKKGWETLPLHDAIDRQMLDSDAIAEVQNTLCFFTVASWFHSMKERIDLYTLMNGYGAQTTASDCTEYMSSLRTSTPAENTGVMAIA
jgi:hypothetical protein